MIWGCVSEKGVEKGVGEMIFKDGTMNGCAYTIILADNISQALQKRDIPA